VLASRATSEAALAQSLDDIRAYDIAAWAKSVRINDATIPFDDLVNLGAIWKLAADIYACSIIRTLTKGHGSGYEPPEAASLRQKYAHFERQGNELIKCLIWPTFIAGVVSNSQQDRAWVLKMLDRIWYLGRCTNTKNASRVLKWLWEQHDHVINQIAGESRRADSKEWNWDWVYALSQLNESWLFV
jgi:hypothetical protein